MKVREALAILASLAALALGVCPALADDGSHAPAAKHPGLERFKQLAGDWVGTMSEDGKGAQPVTAKYATTSGGTAVVETLGPGTKHEMVTVIHPDGKELALTHYCSIGFPPSKHSCAQGRMGAEGGGVRATD
jgi:hypothetical protein